MYRYHLHRGILSNFPRFRGLSMFRSKRGNSRQDFSNPPKPSKMPTSDDSSVSTFPNSPNRIFSLLAHEEMWEQKSMNSNNRLLGCNLWVTLFALDTYFMGPIIKIQTVKHVYKVQNSYVFKYRPLIPHIFWDVFKKKNPDHWINISGFL